MAISVGTFVTGNESIGQTKVYFYCAPWMSVFESRHRNTAFHNGNVMGTTAFGGGGVTVLDAFLLVVS